MKKITDIKKYLSSFDGGDKAFEFLQTADDTTPKGRHDFSDRLYVNLVSYETKKGFDGVFESHREYNETSDPKEKAKKLMLAIYKKHLMLTE